MTFNSMSHVGLEDDFVTPAQLTQMSQSWHYGWEWSGPEPTGSAMYDVISEGLLETYRCICTRAACGLITVPDRDCVTHRDRKVGSAKQLHKATDCPAIPRKKDQ